MELLFYAMQTQQQPKQKQGARTNYAYLRSKEERLNCHTICQNFKFVKKWLLFY